MLRVPDDAAGGVGFFTACAKKFRVIDGNETPCNVKLAEAQNNFYVIARSIFQKLFDWLIAKINAAVKLENEAGMNWTAVLGEIYFHWGVDGLKNETPLHRVNTTATTTTTTTTATATATATATGNMKHET